MSAHEFLLTCRVQASPERVFDFFADHESFGRIWSGKTRRCREGEDTPNGKGSARRIQVGPLAFEEVIITHERPKLIEYTSNPGSPARNHLGHIEFHADENQQKDQLATRIHYVIRFEPIVPMTGALMEFLICRDWRRGSPAIIREIENAGSV